MDQRQAMIAAVREKVEKEKAAKAAKLKKEQEAMQLAGVTPTNTDTEDGKPKYKTLSAEELQKIEEKKNRKLAAERGIVLEESVEEEKPTEETIVEKEAAPEVAETAKEETAPKKTENEPESLGMSVGIQPDKSGKSLSESTGKGGLNSTGGLGGLSGKKESGKGLGLNIEGIGEESLEEREDTKTVSSGSKLGLKTDTAKTETESRVEVKPDVKPVRPSMSEEKAKLQPTKIVGGDSEVKIISDDADSDAVMFSRSGDTTIINDDVQWEASKTSDSGRGEGDDIINIVPNRSAPSDDVKSMYDLGDDEEDMLGAEISKLAGFEEAGKASAESEKLSQEETEKAKQAAEEEAKKKAEEDAKKAAADEIARARAEEQARKRAEAEEAARQKEAERKRKMEEAERKEAERQRRIAEAKKAAEEMNRKKAEEAAAKKAEEEAKRKALEEQRQKATEEARKKIEDEARAKAKGEALKKAEEARKKAEEAAKILEEAKKAEEEAARQAEENKKFVEEEARRAAEEEEARKAAEEARRAAEEEAAREAEEEARKAAEEEAVRKAAEEARRAAEEEARKAAEEEARRAAEEARKQAEEARKILEAAKKAEEEALRKAEEAKKKAEEEAKRAAEEAAKRAAEEAAKRAAKEEAKKAAEEKAKREAEEAAKKKAEEEARRKADEAAHKKAEEEALKASEEAKRKAEEARRILEEAKKAEEEALKAAEEAESIKLDLTKPAENGKLPMAAYYLEKYTQIPNVGDELVGAFNSVAKEPDKSRNIVLLGDHGFGLTAVGEDFARSFYDMGICKAKTIAKIKAAALNKVQLSDAMAKLAGGCLVVENAGLIIPEKLSELVKLADEKDVISILTGEHGSILRLFDNARGVSNKFNFRIRMSGLSNDDMLKIGKGYISQRGFQADDSVDGRIRSLLMAMENGNVDRLIKAVDDAIVVCEEREKSKGLSKKNLLAEDFK